MNQVRKQRLIGARVMIEGYVCNLLNKLDFTSRAQIVTWLANGSASELDQEKLRSRGQSV